MMNFNGCTAFCVKKPNNCATFAFRGSAKRNLHYKRLQSQDLCVRTLGWSGRVGEAAHATVLPTAVQTVPQRFGDLTFGITLVVHDDMLSRP